MDLVRVIPFLAVVLTFLVVLPVALAFAAQGSGPKLDYLRRHWRWFLFLSSAAWLVHIALILSGTAQGSLVGVLPSLVGLGATIAAVLFRGHESVEQPREL